MKSFDRAALRRRLCVCGMVLCLTVLSGCAHQAWVKNDGDPYGNRGDRYACMQQAMADAPPLPTFVPYGNEPSVYPPDWTCQVSLGEGKTRCRPDEGHPKSGTMRYTTIDSTAMQRDAKVSACMQKRGWTYQWTDKPD